MVVKRRSLVSIFLVVRVVTEGASARPGVTASLPARPNTAIVIHEPGRNTSAFAPSVFEAVDVHMRALVGSMQVTVCLSESPCTGRSKLHYNKTVS